MPDPSISAGMTDDDRISRLSRGEGELDEQELMRRYLQRLTDWSEPGAIRVYRNGNLVGSLAELRKWKPKIPWARPKR